VHRLQAAGEDAGVNRPQKVVVIVCDSLGVGAAPDAADYGDLGSDTVGHTAAALGGLSLPTLGAWGLGRLTGVAGVPPVDPGAAVVARMAERSAGKDTTTGHWEMMGVVLDKPFPTYPNGFPGEVIDAFAAAIGRQVLGNRPASGTEIIKELGAEHLATGKPIVYTSADSVFQIATHKRVVPLEQLYAWCETARELLTGEHAVGRVIARPFEGEPGSFQRREGRRDYSALPPSRSYLDELQEAGVRVHGVGKIRDLFAGVGVDEKHDGGTNAKGIAATTRLLRELDSGLVFVNLVETDQVYGHRHDVEGFYEALKAIDAAAVEWLDLLREDDLLVLTADHGVDPNAPHTDHTREYAPLLASFTGHGGRRHDGPLADVGASVLKKLTGREAPELPGEPFL
jgi:phosphopentomutase